MHGKWTLQRLYEAARSFANALGSAKGPHEAPSRPGLALGALRSRRRLVLVFAPRANAENLAAQRAILSAGREPLAERDVAALFVVGDTVTAEKGADPGVAAAILRARFGVPGNAFRVILVGKDGGAKLRSNKPLQAETLIATIDALPLRQHEKRRRAGSAAGSPAARSSLKGGARLRK
jgi:hypothetical protein